MDILIAGHCDLTALQPYLSEGTENLPPGVAAVPVRNLVTALLDRGHQVTLVTLDPRVNEEVEANGERLRIRVGRSRAAKRARDFFRLEREYISRAISMERPDVVHAQWTYEYALGALAAKRAPTLVTVHDWGPAILRFHPHPFRAVRLLMQLETLRRRPYLTTVSPCMQRRLKALVRGEEVHLVPNGIRDDLFNAGEGEQHKGSEPPLIVAVNEGWSSYKNVSSLLRAFPSVLKRVRDARLVLIGREYGRGETAEVWAASEGLTKGVEFLGQLPNTDVIAWIRNADVFAHPAREESFGLVLVEAMASRTAVVGGARSGGVPWVLDYGLAGLLCDVRRPEHLSAQLLLLIEQSDKRKHFAQRGYTRAHLNFRMSTVADQYLALYERFAT